MRPSPAASFLSAVLFSLPSHADQLQKRALSAPAGFANGWQYQGCYVDVGRTINVANTADAQMTNQECVSYCFGKGLPYAGTEYYTQCFCGSALATGGVKGNEADCSTPCGGNATEACGGPNRLTLYTTTQISGPQVNPGPDGWVSQGCYTEGTTGRALTTGLNSVPGNQMTVAKCTAGCKAGGFNYAGVEYGGECYCGKQISNGAVPATSGCTMTCNGNSTEFCGGGGRLNLYSNGAVSTPSSTSGPAPTGICPTQPGTIGQFQWYGCYTEGTNTRALNSKTYADDGMTLETCASFCAGYTYFGVEYSRECYCGNSLSAGSVVAASTDCSMICAGANCDYCGAGSRLSVYSLNAPGSTTGGPTVSTTAVPTSTSAATPTGLPQGWGAYGCWVDGANGRILNKQLPDDNALTLESCAQACASQGYTIAGAEYSKQCFCGNNIVNGGVKAQSDTECNTACAGNPAEKCGGGGRMTIMSNGAPVVLGPPAPLPTVGDWTYQGCYLDNVNQARTFFWQNIYKTMTPAQCLNQCAAFGYMAAGLEYGQECYCGDPANIVTVGSTKRPETECNIPCAGNASAICGGGSRLSTYFWTGDPFYSWSFPEAGSAAAGSYELLIGGVCIPLMTSQAITGKVTFLEKWGTGPPNSTGAYELDLSQINNFQAAWRTMHLKTDVFCAAGITLPDKAGRQLTVGGWSGDSTYGVRLYTPDGSPGVKGTNDWEENVDVLKLQQGRWYPSAMNMANGSVLVIGGEKGSNSAPVPTLEILPFTGTAPLYMDWLERTDPNNLYPFCTVLPSGGIFVAYWNEARILDENTFATIKTLPNMPGAVNDPLGGRTYPLEGTAVLLPMHAPFTEPLGVLICGGSTEGPGNALDNCVSTYPDAANPTWTLERMPSTRVMSCIAPLPDGTFLILNGAHHGVAGFGLGVDPNLNALLYNPSKPIGHRITIMANTTVARLYHSEAITLLDGRVMVSGSDPEDGKNPQEYRVESFTPPYLKSGLPRPSFSITNKDWTYNQQVTVQLGAGARNGAITASLLGSVSSTHGNSMGGRTLFPAISCAGTTCTVTAPPGKYIAPPGWYQFFILDGGIPAVGVFVRIGGDPAKVGNWPQGNGFTTPGV
ncbi:WSC domain-containing protein [Cladobotryum mycophilum]|uniref:WSC domain-containing protein n=1 Tax=Cladobotryum mycophilum TaxID=491253 RepID=A0ABR0SEA5_9HYPO